MPHGIRVVDFSTQTAESHVEHIMTKLGLSDRAQIASWVGTWSPDR